MQTARVHKLDFQNLTAAPAVVSRASAFAPVQIAGLDVVDGLVVRGAVAVAAIILLISLIIVG